MSTDNDLCLPVIDPDRLYWILCAVNEMVGEGGRPQLTLDLEQLQVIDYASLDRLTDQQKAFIVNLSKESPIRAEEMAYLALRSMYCFTWPMPEDVEDIQRASAYELALNAVLTSTALDVGRDLSEPGARLPYWGRLSYLRVLSRLPADQVAQYNLDKVAVALIKRNAFNATTFALEGAHLIGLNFALEPILKSLNRYLLHFYCSREMAGSARMSRGWSAILPTVLYFWANAAANKLAQNLPFFDSEAAQIAQWITVSQIDFILMHEFGHVVLDHPKRLVEVSKTKAGVTSIRHEFEFSADAFAYELIRSNLLNELRGVAGQTAKDPAQPQDITNGRASFAAFMRDREAVRLLFIYMHFIDRAGRLLKSRVGSQIKFRSHFDSHPSADARQARLDAMHLGDIGGTTERVRYAEGFFDDVLKYAESLDEAALLTSVAGIC